MKKILIIGYGNSLRSDDGAGQKVAEAFFNIEGVEAIAMHQLTPELAENISQAEQVYFIDAAPVEEITIQPLQTENVSLNLGHFSDPVSLLKLAQSLYNNSPPAYLVMIPADNFDLGDRLSESTQTAVQTAIKLLQERLTLCFK